MKNSSQMISTASKFTPAITQNKKSRTTSKKKTSKHHQDHSQRCKSASKTLKKTKQKNALLSTPSKEKKRLSLIEDPNIQAFTNQKLNKTTDINRKMDYLQINRPSHIRQDTQQERIKMMEQYLKQDADQFGKMKSISDKHIISQMRLTQDSLKKKLDEAYQQSKVLIETHRRQLLQINEKQQNMSEKYHKQKVQLRAQTLEERRKSLGLQKKVKEQEGVIRQLQQKFMLEKNQLKIGKSTQSENIQNPQANKVNELETEIAVLQGKVQKLLACKQNLQAEVEQHKKQKKFIRQQAGQVLGFLKDELQKPYDLGI